MHTLTKDDALKFLPPHVWGQYNPAKYLLGGYIGTQREVLLHLYREAVQANKAVRALAAADRISTGLIPLNEAAKSGNTPKLFRNTPRDVRVMIPKLRQYGDDAFLVFTNCKLNGGFYKSLPGVTPVPEMIDFATALRAVQSRKLP